jgi:tRNA pseudouridine13 synthase
LSGLFDKLLPACSSAHLARTLPRLSQEPIPFRPHPGAFQVTEILPHDLDGEGEHLFMLIEKRGLGTPGLLRHLGQTLGVREREMGIAGRKDAAGITRQWVSLPARRVPDPSVVENDAITVVKADRHRKKLRLGQHRGNQFEIQIQTSMAQAEFERRLAGMATFPNYFGHQRFGGGPENLERALGLLERRRRTRGRRDAFLLSVFQAAVFNHWLHHRIQDGVHPRALLGDWMVASGKQAPRPFQCNDVDGVGAQVDKLEVSVAGPLVGQKLRPPGSDAMTWESRIWEGLGVSLDDLCLHPALDHSARRASRVVPGGLSSSWQPDRITLSFTLPPGAYATVFLEELLGQPLEDLGGGPKVGQGFAAQGNRAPKPT